MKPGLLLVCCALALTLGACWSTQAAAGRLATPESFTGFPTETIQDSVCAQAYYYLNHEDVFDEDLIAEEHLIPVALNIGSVRTADPIQVSDFRLFLPDGTELVAIADNLDRIADGDLQKVMLSKALTEQMLEPFDAKTTPRFVYFELPEGAEYVEGKHMIRRVVGDVERNIDVTKSLCSFTVNINKTFTPHYVGLETTRATSR